MKALILATGLAIVAPTVQADPSTAIAAFIGGVVVNELAHAPRHYHDHEHVRVIREPVPVLQPQIVTVPQSRTVCPPGYHCVQTLPVIQCDHWPMFDEYGRVVAYYKTCK